VEKGRKLRRVDRGGIPPPEQTDNRCSEFGADRNDKRKNYNKV